jgi:hypothetical protein
MRIKLIRIFLGDAMESNDKAILMVQCIVFQLQSHLQLKKKLVLQANLKS